MNIVKSFKHQVIYSHTVVYCAESTTYQHSSENEGKPLPRQVTSCIKPGTFISFL